ncbi:hypothetical protein AV530_018698 [Patagioenas fasciata monilis]|uniref:Uncharacterized protein n=1 Tax=Patagioenas fasciata monilis TaxID=372326 RepID=A0A1V4JJL8_PATFA|nr:hypothetical protein AV530_018698 [Patagioenas fasciata monilis]
MYPSDGQTAFTFWEWKVQTIGFQDKNSIIRLPQGCMEGSDGEQRAKPRNLIPKKRTDVAKFFLHQDYTYTLALSEQKRSLRHCCWERKVSSSIFPASQSGVQQKPHVRPWAVTKHLTSFSISP